MKKTILATAALSLLATAAVPSFAANGPVSKFNGMKPTAEYMSSASLEDIERCLIDMEGWRAPNVYRQPDRPNAVMLLWPDPSGLSAARMDLTRTPGGIRVKSWMPANQARACSPQRLDR